MLLRGFDCNRRAIGCLQPKSHQRFVHRADVFDVERSIRNALAIKDEKVL